MSSENICSAVSLKSETYINRLPWRKFTRGGGFWIYADEAPELARKLVTVRYDVRIGDFVYKLKRIGIKLFIHRFPARKKKTGDNRGI